MRRLRREPVDGPAQRCGDRARSSSPSRGASGRAERPGAATAQPDLLPWQKCSNGPVTPKRSGGSGGTTRRPAAASRTSASRVPPSSPSMSSMKQDRLAPPAVSARRPLADVALDRLADGRLMSPLLGRCRGSWCERRLSNPCWWYRRMCHRPSRPRPRSARSTVRACRRGNSLRRSAGRCGSRPIQPAPRQVDLAQGVEVGEVVARTSGPSESDTVRHGWIR